jgi:hypothetical protein
MPCRGVFQLITTECITSAGRTSRSGDFRMSRGHSVTQCSHLESSRQRFQLSTNFPASISYKHALTFQHTIRCVQTVCGKVWAVVLLATSTWSRLSVVYARARIRTRLQIAHARLREPIRLSYGLDQPSESPEDGHRSHTFESRFDSSVKFWVTTRHWITAEHEKPVFFIECPS